VRYSSRNWGASLFRGSWRGIISNASQTWNQEHKTYEFDGHLLIVQQIGAFENDAEGALANLLADAIMHADHVGRGRHGLRRAGARRALLQSGDG
jgi:hypothetical protein